MEFREGDIVQDRSDPELVGTVIGVSDFGDVMVDWGSGTDVVPPGWLRKVE